MFINMSDTILYHYVTANYPDSSPFVLFGYDIASADVIRIPIYKKGKNSSTVCIINPTLVCCDAAKCRFTINII